MPFLWDTGSRDERRGPIWETFAVVRDNLERMVALNAAWSMQLLPGVLALAFPGLPPWLRAAMLLYSATLIIPATGALYALMLSTARGEPPSVELALGVAREMALPSLLRLTPLLGLFGVLAWTGMLVPAPAVTTLVTLLCLLWYVCSVYWGPLLVLEPELGSVGIARGSAELVWHYPLQSLAICAVATSALAVGVASVGGFFLIVPVVVALLHVEMCVHLLGRAPGGTGRR